MDLSFPVPEHFTPERRFPARATSQYSSATLEKDQEELWNGLRQFYAKNEETIERSRTLDIEAIGGSDKGAQIQDAVDTFIDTANIVLDGLVALGNVHPVLGVAIFAFHGVIRLDLTRRENDSKVLAVKLQMQTMMCAMFQMCQLRHEHVHDDQKEIERAQLQRLVKTIADEITQCGSDLNYYSNRKLVSKLIKAKIYQRRFADHVATFAQRRSELQTTIAAYMAAGIDAANIAISEVGKKVTVVDEKIDSLLAFFRRLDTPHEREVLKFIDENGGPQNCVNKDDLLLTLLSKSTESATQPATLTEMRKSLRAEMLEDMDTVLSQNLNRFEKLLNVQNNNLERISDQIEQQGHNMQDHNMKLDKLVSTSILILEEGKLIKKAIVPNTRIKLKDPELQQIWDRMGLRRSVKAKQFVLTFRDYLVTNDHSTPSTPQPHAASTLHPEPSSVLFSTSPPQAPGKLPSHQLSAEGEADPWVLKHIDVAHVQPIVEAMDEDGSGFISVAEANKFALSRPKGMSLLNWIAYWAAGWHYNITDYQQKLYSILLQMHKLSSTVLLVNRKVVHMYLDNVNYFRLESILRSIRPLPDNTARDPKLVEIAESVASAEEERLKINLEEISYLIQSPADVALITGTGRLETWLFPLLYLVLDRHLALFKIGQTRVLHMDELDTHSTSLWSIVSSYDERMNRLKDIFRQVYRDTEAQFGNFAYGMFLGSFKWTGVMKPLENTLLAYNDTTSSEAAKTETCKSKVEGTLDLSILAKGLGPSLELPEPDLGGPPLDHVPHSIEGSWIGIYESSSLATAPPYQFVIGPVADGKLAALGRDYTDAFKIDGTFDAKSGLVDFKLVYENYPSRWFKGKFDTEKDVIRGQWVVESESGDIPPAGDVPPTEEKLKLQNGRFRITRNSPTAFRFRELLGDLEPTQSPPLSIARKRWAFALEAVLFDVQQKMGSWKFMRARIAERNSWIELSIRDLLPGFLQVTRGFLSPDESKRWRTLVKRLHPSVAIVYEAMAMYLYDRYWYSVGAAWCDTCRQRIPFRRYICITCVEEDRSNQLDFCVDDKCIESLTVFESRDFVHSFSHTLLRCTQRILHYETPTVISQAEIRSERIKRSFREQEAKNNGSKEWGRKADKMISTKTVHAENELQGKPSLASLVCASCSKDLTLPCWACATCTLDTLICMDCEKQRSPLVKKPGVSNTHSSDHPLLRIFDSAEAKLIKLKSNNKQLEDMEARINIGINDGLDTLEQKVNAHLEKVQLVVESVAKNIATREETAAVNNGEHPDSRVVASNGILQDQSRYEDRITALETKLGGQLTALETKVEMLLSLMQQAVAITSKPLNIQ